MQPPSPLQMPKDTKLTDIYLILLDQVKAAAEVAAAPGAAALEAAVPEAVGLDLAPE